MHYRTSKEYKKLLKKSKINNVTVKKENSEYYAIINITTTEEQLKKKGNNISTDIRQKKHTTISNKQEITKLNLKNKDEQNRK